MGSFALLPALYAIFENPLDVRVRPAQNGAARDITEEVFDFGERRMSKLTAQTRQLHFRVQLELSKKAPKELINLLGPRCRKLKTKLESSPNSSIQQLGMIRCRHNDHMCRKLVHLEQECADHAFDFSGLVSVAALLANGVEFVEEQDTLPLSRMVKDPTQTRGGFAEVAADQAFVANEEERSSQIMGQCASYARLSVSRWTNEQDAMPRGKTI